MRESLPLQCREGLFSLAILESSSKLTLAVFNGSVTQYLHEQLSLLH